MQTIWGLCWMYMVLMAKSAPVVTLARAHMGRQRKNYSQEASSQKKGSVGKLSTLQMNLPVLV